MKYSMTLDPGKKMSVSEMRRLLARTLSKLKGDSLVTKLSFSIAIVPAEPCKRGQGDFPKGD